MKGHLPATLLLALLPLAGVLAEPENTRPPQTAPGGAAPPPAAAPEAPRPALEVRYVTDRLRLGMKDNPEGKGRNIRLLKSGDRIEILEKRGAYSLVRTEDGTEGWAKSAFMVRDKPAILVVDEYRARIAELEAQIERLKAGGKLVEVRPDPAQKQRIVELELALGEARRKIAELKAALEARPAVAEGAAEAAAPSAGTPDDSPLAGIGGVLAALALGLLIGGGTAWYLYDRRLRRRFAGLRV